MSQNIKREKNLYKILGSVSSPANGIEKQLGPCSSPLYWRATYDNKVESDVSFFTF